MFAQVHCPHLLKSEELDSYLERGWFRMGQNIFTTNFLNFKGEYYSAIWLRVLLNEFSAGRTEQKLIKMNAAFRIEIQHAFIDPVKEALFADYKQHVSFEASASLQTLLFGKAVNNLYNTYEVNLYDRDKLIACGFFDIGGTSAAGIASFYDPTYKKYSLGRYLIFLKMNYCKKFNLQYFYPGYFVPGYPFFDYKLKIAGMALQYLEVNSQRWLPINSFLPARRPIQVMYDKLSGLEVLLTQSQIVSRLLKYGFFDANLIPELRDAALLDFPIFIYCFNSTEETINPIIVYDIHDQQYHLIKCISIWKPDPSNNVAGIYSSHLLKIQHDIFSSPQPQDMVDALLDISANNE